MSDDGQWVEPTAVELFAGRYRFLSNFHPAPIRMRGRVYPSVEHAYQAAKTLDPEERERIRLAVSAAEAKRLGRRATLRPGWEQMKADVMLALLRAKFKDQGLAARLVATGDRLLVEGNTWGDRFWGATLRWDATEQRNRWVGDNKLGELLMQVRAEVKHVDWGRRRIDGTAGDAGAAGDAGEGAVDGSDPAADGTARLPARGSDMDEHRGRPGADAARDPASRPGGGAPRRRNPRDGGAGRQPRTSRAALRRDADAGRGRDEPPSEGRLADRSGHPARRGREPWRLP